MRKPRLTKRQAEVLLLTANGKTGAEIARQLGITVNTVSEVLVVAYRRLGARDRAQAVAIALCLNEIDAYDIDVPEAPSRYRRKAA